MLGLDEKRQATWRRKARAENSAERRQKELEHEIWTSTISVAPDGSTDTGNLLAQLGRPLTSWDVQRRLKLCNPGLIFEVAIQHPELTGIYYERDERTTAGTWTKRKVHICGMESGIMPEFSVLHRTEKRLPNPELLGNTEAKREVDWLNVPTFASETRGWRTVLLRLLKSGLVTRADISKHFDWAPSRGSEKWQSQT